MKDTFEQSLINRITYKGISITTGDWVEGQPFLASLGQIGLASPMEYTNVLTAKGDNIGIQCMATDFFCARIYPTSLCQSLDLYAVENENASPSLIFENDILEFEYKGELVKGHVQLIAGTYVIFRVEFENPEDEYICCIDELATNSSDYKTLRNVKITGNLYDDYFSEDELHINPVQFDRRDFAQMIYNSGGKRHLS